MEFFFIAALLVLLISMGLGILWRYAPLPCPSSFSWLLENPYIQAFAGSEQLLDRVDLVPGMKVMDIGCGPGRLTIPAAKRVGPSGLVVALDIQLDMLRRIKEKAEALDLDNIQLVHTSAGEDKVRESDFDRVLLVSALGEIPKRAAALTEMYRALKQGGVLSVTEIMPDLHYQSRKTVRRLATKAGFEEQNSFGSWFAYTLNFVKPGNSKSTTAI